MQVLESRSLCRAQPSSSCCWPGAAATTVPAGPCHLVSGLSPALSHKSTVIPARLHAKNRERRARGLTSDLFPPPQLCPSAPVTSPSLSSLSLCTCHLPLPSTLHFPQAGDTNPREQVASTLQSALPPPVTALEVGAPGCPGGRVAEDVGWAPVRGTSP